MNNWNELHITDKTGQQWFKTIASPMSTDPEMRNLYRKIPNCSFIDQATAEVVINGASIQSVLDMSDDDLLAMLAA